MSNNNHTKIWNRSLDDIMSESFGKYAKYIIQDRALPDIRDGLKPVQRRILYAMNELKIHYDKPYKKSARTVGEVIGKYHPHGDSSIYEAMVRMAQEWKNNIPLLDMQGNKGSIDGDGPAAMRYTECRLSKFGQYMMNNIQKETVKFISNFDDSEQEPSVLPSLLPNILINGATGIAAGYATNIPPFNFNEVMQAIIFRINNPDSKLSDITKIIKGPDFPTGGIIQGKEGINDIFATGKGKFFIRAKIEEEPTRASRKTKRLVVKEIPFDTNKAALVKSLDEIRINNELPGFKEVRDDSDKSGISIVLEFDTDKDLEIIKAFLYKKTQLQISYTANVVLIKDRKPVQVGIIEILDSFITHINEIVIKSSIFDLNKALARKEILEGLIKAISDIDVLVNLIKSSTSKDEAKKKIEDHFKVNERQSEAIVNLRLYVLTSYDTEKLKQEYDELLKFIEEKEQLINSQEYRNKHLSNLLLEHQKELSVPRKSLLEDKVEEIEIKTSDIIEEVKGTCILTRDNYIKFVNDNTIQEFDLLRTKIKETDLPIDIFKLSTLDYLVCFTNKGKCITIPAYKIKMSKLRDIGVHINEIVTIDSSEKTICAFAINKFSDISTEILVATKNSLIKRILIEDLNLSKNAKSLSYINLKNNDEVVNVQVLTKQAKEVIAITEQGFATKYSLDEIPIVGRTAAGVKNMNLKVKDLIATTISIPNDENFIIITSNRGGKRLHINDIPTTSRGKSGKRIFQQVESNPYIVNWAAIVSGRSSIYLLTENGTIETKISDIPISDTTTRMNSFSKVDGQILKSSYLAINKNFVENSETNNFNTLNDETTVSKNSSKKAVSPTKIEEVVNEKREFIIDVDDENAKPIAVTKKDLIDDSDEDLENDIEQKNDVETNENKLKNETSKIDDNNENEDEFKPSNKLSLKEKILNSFASLNRNKKVDIEELDNQKSFSLDVKDKDNKSFDDETKEFDKEKEEIEKINKKSEEQNQYIHVISNKELEIKDLEEKNVLGDSNKQELSNEFDKEIIDNDSLNQNNNDKNDDLDDNDLYDKNNKKQNDDNLTDDDKDDDLEVENDLNDEDKEELSNENNQKQNNDNLSDDDLEVEDDLDDEDDLEIDDDLDDENDEEEYIDLDDDEDKEELSNENNQKQNNDNLSDDDLEVEDDLEIDDDSDDEDDEEEYIDLDNDEDKEELSNENNQKQNNDNLSDDDLEAEDDLDDEDDSEIDDDSDDEEYIDLDDDDLEFEDEEFKSEIEIQDIKTSDVDKLIDDTSVEKENNSDNQDNNKNKELFNNELNNKEQDSKESNSKTTSNNLFFDFEDIEEYEEFNEDDDKEKK